MNYFITGLNQPRHKLAFILFFSVVVKSLQAKKLIGSKYFCLSLQHSLVFSRSLLLLLSAVYIASKLFLQASSDFVKRGCFLGITKQSLKPTLVSTHPSTHPPKHSLKVFPKPFVIRHSRQPLFPVVLPVLMRGVLVYRAMLDR